MAHKNRKKEISCFMEAYGISKLLFFDQKNIKEFSALNFFQFYVIKTLYPLSGSDSGLVRYST
jgi:hypothetical protein